MLGFNMARDAARNLDSRIQAESLKRHEGLKARNIGAMRDRLQGIEPGLVAKEIADNMKLGGAELANLESRTKGANGRRRVIEQYAPQMSRGPLKGMGVAEYLSGITAANAGVRRTGFGALGAGATVATGALATEGAQQLMALMGFMQQEQQMAQRAQESPLA